MPFGFGSRTVAQRDVEFNVNLGQFRADLGAAEGVYNRTTGAMSEDALRLSVAQERVARAIKITGTESLRTKAATIALRHEMDSLAAANTRVAASAGRSNLGRDERQASQLLRGGIKGAGGLGGLGFASLAGGAFVGSFVAASAVRAALDAAKNEQVALGQLQVALRDTGHAWGTYGTRIEAALEAQVKSTAFTKEELTGALANNVRRFGDVNQALRANAIDADVARAKNISLAAAQTLIQRASLGQSRSLLSLGIVYTKSTANVDALKASTKHATAEQLLAAKAADALANRTGALDAVEQKFHGNAAKYLTTTAGKQALFNAELKQSEAIIGIALLPVFNKLLTSLSTWLERMNRSGKLQRDLNEAVKDGTIVFHALKAILAPLVTGFRLLGTAVGGTKHELELLTAVAIGLATRKALIAGGILSIGGAATTAEGEVAGLRGGLLSLGNPEVLLGLAAVYDALLLINDEMSHHTKGHAQTGGSAKLNTEVFEQGGKYYERVTVGRNVVTKEVTKAQAQATLGQTPVTHGPGSAHGGGGGFGGGSDTTTAPGRHRRPLILGLTEAQQTALLRAQGTPGTADDVQALNAQLAIYNRLVAQPGLNASQLNSLLSSRDSVLSQLDSITSSASHAGESAAKKAAAARKRAAALRAKKLVELLRHDESVLQLAVKQALLTPDPTDDIDAAKRLEAFYKRQAHNPRLTRALRDAFAAKDVGVKLAIQKLTKGEAASFGKLEQEFLDAFTNIQASFGSNIKPPVTVIQQFHAPPTTDGHREARIAKIAAGSAWDQ